MDGEKNHLINTIINSTALYDTTVLRLIKIEPTTNVQEVVRCKDCSFYEEIDYYPDGTKSVCRLLKRQMQADDFCSYGAKIE